MPIAAGEFSEKCLGEQGDVPSAFAERGQFENDHGESIEQVLAELANRHGLAQVHVRRSDDTYIDLDGAASTDAFDALFLEEPKEFNLKRRWKFTDFIQEQGSARGRLDATDALGVRAREGAFFVAEQFALEERLGDRSAVDGNEGRIFSHTAAMDCQGGHLFSGPTFTKDQDGRIRSRDLPDGREHVEHTLTRSEQSFKGVGPLLALEFHEIPLQLRDMKGPLEDDFELGHFNGFGEKIVRTFTNRPYGIGSLTLSTDDDDFDFRIFGEQVGQSSDAFRGVSRAGGKPEVQKDDCGVVSSESCQGAESVFSEDDLVVGGECPAHLGTDFLIVIDH